MSGYMFERLEKVDFEKKLAYLYHLTYNCWASNFSKLGSTLFWMNFVQLEKILRITPGFIQFYIASLCLVNHLFVHTIDKLKCYVTLTYTEHCSVWSYQFYRYYRQYDEDDSLCGWKSLWISKFRFLNLDF